MPIVFVVGSRALRVVFWATLVVVTALSLAPQSGREMVLPLQDKILHAGAYTCFYFLGWLGFAHSSQSVWSVRLIFGLLTYGIVIEILQGMTGYRDSDIVDVLANITGLCLGLGAVALYRRKER